MKVNINSVDRIKDFVKVAESIPEDVDLVSGRYVVDAKSIMGVFSLDISKPVELVIHAENAAEFESRFDAFRV